MFILLSTILVLVLLMFFLALRIPALNISPLTTHVEKIEAIEQWLSCLHKANKFNGCVLLSKNGQVLLEKSYGLNDVEGKCDITGESSFNLASISKQFTAMGVMLLKQKAQLDYEDRISKYIPELGFYSDITVRHLLQHTSGLPDYMRIAIKNKRDRVLFTVAELIDLYTSQRPKLNFIPGEKFDYSNTGYVLLSLMIERISGKAFSDFMTESIFRPLGMSNAQVFNLLSDNEPANRVFGYARKHWLFGGKTQQRDLNCFDGVAGDGGVYASVQDLYRWDKGLTKGLLIPVEDYEEAYKPAILTNGREVGYGFGWFLNDDGSVEHAGSWQGFSSFVFRNRQNQELVVILDNSANSLRVNSMGFKFNSIGLNLKEAICEL